MLPKVVVMITSLYSFKRELGEHIKEAGRILPGAIECRWAVAIQHSLWSLGWLLWKTGCKTMDFCSEPTRTFLVFLNEY